MVLALVFSVVIFYPKTFFYTNYHQYKQFHVFFCGNGPFPSNIAASDSVLSHTEFLLKKVQFSSAQQPYKLFFRNKNTPCINLPLQFNKEAYAQTIPVVHNIFVWDADFQTNRVFIPSGHHRPYPQYWHMK